MAGSYLRKCPYCHFFVYNRRDLQLHVKAVHGVEIDDVPPYNVVEEAARKTCAKFVYEYKPSVKGRCELCGRAGQCYIIAFDDGSKLIRCWSCLTQIMASLKAVRFIPKERKDKVKGWRIIEAGQATLR